MQLQIFTRSLSDIDLLERVFGGNHYPHRVGIAWIVGKKENLLDIAEQVRLLPSLPDERMALLLSFVEECTSLP